MMQGQNDMTEEIPGLEPWLAVAVLALVPMIAAFVLHADVLPYLLSFGGALVVTSLVTLVRQEHRKRGSVTQPLDTEAR